LLAASSLPPAALQDSNDLAFFEFPTKLGCPVIDPGAKILS
jgi:hypothetical protein